MREEILNEKCSRDIACIQRAVRNLKKWNNPFA